MLAATVHVIVPIILATIVNAIIYSKGWNSGGSGGSAGIERGLLPPGWVIGTIWIVIFGLLGFAHYKTRGSATSWAIVAVILYCLSYPFLTSGLNMEKAPLYNTIALLLAAGLGCIALAFNKDVFIYVLPLLIWSGYVNLVDAVSYKI